MSIIKKTWQFITNMSLSKQMWFAVISMMLVAFIANMAVNIISSKRYIEKQLEIKNIDNAVSLAVSISQMPKDLIAIELMLSAQFDNGHYRYVRLMDANGKPMIVRENPVRHQNVPHWFTQLVELHSTPGRAQIQDGWSQFGILSLESATDFAYADLWHGAQNSLYWSILIAFLSGLIGTAIIKLIVQPLNAMVKMTEAISNKNFITIPEPRTLEFKRLAQAMNRLSARIKEMFKEQSQLLEQLRREANYDPITGLMNRKYFISRIDAHIENEDSFKEGVLVICHISNLSEINQRLGGVETDNVLKLMGDALNDLCEKDTTLIAGRLTGADLAVFCNQAIAQQTFATTIKNHLMSACKHLTQQFSHFDLITRSNSVKKSDQFESLRNLIAVIKEKTKPHEMEIMDLIDKIHMSQYANQDASSWHDMLSNALDARRLALAKFPVMTQTGQVIHYECPVRMQLQANGAWVSAGEFINWAIQLNLITRVDDIMLELAFQALASGSEAIGLNVSTRAMGNASYVDKLGLLLKQHSEIASKLWLEVPEDGVFSHLAAFRAFCQKLKPFGCKIGVEHVGAQIARLGELHDLNLDYIKIDASVIRDIDSNTGNQAFLKGLCLIAQSIGLYTIAEGVQTERELHTLPQLGVQAMTGPAVKLLD